MVRIRPRPRHLSCIDCEHSRNFAQLPWNASAKSWLEFLTDHPCLTPVVWANTPPQFSLQSGASRRCGPHPTFLWHSSPDESQVITFQPWSYFEITNFTVTWIYPTLLFVSLLFSPIFSSFTAQVEDVSPSALLAKFAHLHHHCRPPLFLRLNHIHSTISSPFLGLLTSICFNPNNLLQTHVMGTPF